MNTPDPMSARRGRRKVLWMAALFFVPLALAFWLYYGPTGWRPSGSTNQGHLIDPARPLPDVDLAIAAGTPATAKLLRGRWSVVYIGDGNCDQRCRRALYLMRQTRTALGRDAGRIECVFLVTTDRYDRDFVEREHPDLVVAMLGDRAGRDLLAQFPTYRDGPVGTAGRIYLVDPLGNLLMSYPATVPDKAVLKDLEKLLRLSHIG